MRRAGLFRFFLLGVAGFGIGGLLIGVVAHVVLIPVAGAIGGASLGLALLDWKRGLALAVMGALGSFFGIVAVLIAGSFVNYVPAITGAAFGATVGASISIAFLNLEEVPILTVAGAVGFRLGFVAGSYLDHLTPDFGRIPLMVAAGVIGGGFLGLATGYLEEHRRTGS